MIDRIRNLIENPFVPEPYRKSFSIGRRNIRMSRNVSPKNKGPNKERCFDLSLPIVVKGLDVAGKEFQEHTELQTISSQLATFWIDSGVIIGSKLNLSLEVPRTLILENQMRLILSGDVVFIKEDGPKKHLISVRLDKNYKFQAHQMHARLK